MDAHQHPALQPVGVNAHDPMRDRASGSAAAELSMSRINELLGAYEQRAVALAAQRTARDEDRSDAETFRAVSDRVSAQFASMEASVSIQNEACAAASARLAEQTRGLRARSAMLQHWADGNAGEARSRATQQRNSDSDARWQGLGEGIQRIESAIDDLARRSAGPDGASAQHARIAGRLASQLRHIRSRFNTERELYSKQAEQRAEVLAKAGEEMKRRMSREGDEELSAALEKEVASIPDSLARMITASRARDRLFPSSLAAVETAVQRCEQTCCSSSACSSTRPLRTTNSATTTTTPSTATTTASADSAGAGGVFRTQALECDALQRRLDLEVEQRDANSKAIISCIQTFSNRADNLVESQSWDPTAVDRLLLQSKQLHMLWQDQAP